jgi:hypothetical protein
LLSDIVQEKENRSGCHEEPKIIRKYRRKQRHSLLNNPEPRPSISSDIKADCRVRSEIKRAEEGDRKKEDSFTKLGTKSKSSHSKKRSVTPKREKHRCSKRKDSRKYMSKTFLDKTEKSDSTANGEQGSSLLMRLQTMMTVNISARKEKAPVSNVKEEDEATVKCQELEHDVGRDLLPPLEAVKSGNEDEKCCSEKAEIVDETDHNHLPEQTSDDIEVLLDTKKPEPVVITIDDSDSELPDSAKVSECDFPEKENKEGDMTKFEGETGTKGINSNITKETDCEDEEDLVQLRLLALQSSRRKETLKPSVEDDEVMQLRLAALKSAIIKKCQVRKQRGIALKSMKANTAHSQDSSDIGETDMQDDLGQKKLKPEATSIEAVRSEPDETTTLVDMDLSHTDDESNVQNEIIIEPVSVDMPLCEDSDSKLLPLVHENYSTQNVPCIDAPLVKAHEDNHVDIKQSQKDDVMPAWNPVAAMYSSPDLENQLSGIYDSNVQISSLNSVGCSSSQVPLPSSSFSQQQLYNEVSPINNSSDLPGTDLDGTVSETVLNPFEVCVSTGVQGSFVLSDVNSSFTSDALLVSKVEPHMASSNTFVPRTQSPSLETNSVGMDVPRAHGVAATKDPQFPSESSNTHRTDTEVAMVTSLQFHAVDCGSGSCQNGDRRKNIHVHSENNVSVEELPSAAHRKATDSAGNDPSPMCTGSAALFSSSLNPQNQGLKGTQAEDIRQNDVPTSASESGANSADCSVHENSSELENMDFSSMIILDEVGQCSSPETKVEEISIDLSASKNEDISSQCDQSTLNLDEDEEVLRAKVLTTLVRKPSTAAACLTSKPQNIKGNTVCGPPEMSSKQQIETSTNSLPVFPNHTSASKINVEQDLSQTSVSRTKERTPSKFPGSQHELKRCNNVFHRLPNKKLELSQSNVSNYSKGNIKAKCWKRSVKKGFTGSNMKQILTVVNKNPVPMKQLKGPSTSVRNGSQNVDLGLKTRISQCTPVSSAAQRVVSHHWAPKPTMIHVTVPTSSVSDKQYKRKIAASVVSSAAPVQSPQRFVIRLGDDSDSPDEEDKIHQLSQTAKRRCVMRNTSSVPSLHVSTSDIYIAELDQVVNCDSNVASSLVSQYDHPVSDTQDTASVLTHHATNTRISADFEKSVDRFLKQQRKSQETTAKETSTPGMIVGRKRNQAPASVTPLV